MGLQSLIQRIAGRQIERQEVGRQSYRELLQEIVAGREPSVDDVEQALTASGKSVDDLKADVQSLEQEARWRKEAGKRDKLIADKRALEEERIQLNEETDRVMAELRGRRQALESRAEVLEADFTTATTARDNLLQHSESQEAMKELHRVISDSTQLLQQLEIEETYLKGQASRLQEALDQTPSYRRDEAKARYLEKKTALDDVPRKRAAALKAIANAKEQLAALEKAALHG